MVANVYPVVTVLPIANKALMFERMHKKGKTLFVLVVLDVVYVLLYAPEEYLNWRMAPKRGELTPLRSYLGTMWI